MEEKSEEMRALIQLGIHSFKLMTEEEKLQWIKDHPEAAVAMIDELNSSLKSWRSQAITTFGELNKLWDTIKTHQAQEKGGEQCSK